ncbi:MAG TPA: hypothetical protein ENO24_09745, partial [Chloroflexi bacterium]|nr:hypothetical protein [Chloroflexota bacterium]
MKTRLSMLLVLVATVAALLLDQTPSSADRSALAQPEPTEDLSVLTQPAPTPAPLPSPVEEQPDTTGQSGMIDGQPTIHWPVGQGLEELVDVEPSALNCTSLANWQCVETRSGLSICRANNVCIVKVDLNSNTLRPRVAIAANGSTAWLSSIASGAGALAAVNGDYFSGCPDPVAPLNCGEGLTFVDGVDYTDYTGSEWQNRRSLGFNDNYDPNIGWPGEQGSFHRQLLGGGPQVTFGGEYRWRCWYQGYNTEGNCLCQNNTVVINDEQFGCSANNWWNRPQTFVGFSDDRNTLYLAKSEPGYNKTPHEMHDVLWILGARHSLKLDGGGSSGMYFRDGGYEVTWNGSWPVANAWVIVPHSPPPPRDAAEFLGQCEYPTLDPGQQFSIWFEVRNTGTTTWRDSDGYGLESNNGVTLGASPHQSIGADVPPGASKRWDIQMTAPTTEGKYRTAWMLEHSGQEFGPYMFIDVTVEHTGPLITVVDVWTTDENDNQTTSFDAGDPIKLKMKINNRGASTTTARVTWDVTDPSGSPYPGLSWDGNLDLQSGVWIWSLSTTIPWDAPTGTFAFTGRVDNNGEISSQSTTFHVQGRIRVL